MRRCNIWIPVCISLVALWVLGCAKQAPPAVEKATPKASEAAKAPEAKQGHPQEEVEASLADEAPEADKAKVNPQKSDAASLGKGKKLYVANCAVCHGDKGDGKGPSAVGLTPPPVDFTDKMMMADHTDGALYWAITNGGGAMPSFSKKLSDEERWALVNQIHTFSK
jgi:mono/diheme cytochrome c family protein